MSIYSDIKNINATMIVAALLMTAPGGAHSASSSPSSRHKAQAVASASPPSDQEPIEVEKRALTKGEQNVEHALQRKAVKYFEEMSRNHPELVPDSTKAPSVVILPMSRPYKDADYIRDDNTIYMTLDAARDKRTRDGILAHEIAHKFPGTEHDHDIRAAEVIGPQRYIDILHRLHGLGDDSREAVNKDPAQHGTIIDREKLIKAAFPDRHLIVPKHSAALLKLDGQN